MKETDFYLTFPVITENVFNFIYQVEITNYQIEILESTLNYIISLEINEWITLLPVQKDLYGIQIKKIWQMASCCERAVCDHGPYSSFCLKTRFVG